MSIIALVLLVALLIPIFGVVLDSPLGRALARRIEGGEPPPDTSLTQILKRMELLESEVDDLTRLVQSLQEENAFLQRLIEDAPPRPTLPPPAGA